MERAVKRLHVITAYPLCLAFLGCGGGDDSGAAPLGPLPQFPVPGCEHIDHSPCDTRMRECDARLFELAACLRGTEPGDLPTITLVSQEQYADYLTGLQHTVFHRPLTDTPFWPRVSAQYEAALVLLGLIEPGALAPQAAVDRRVDLIWGVYRWATKDILMVDHGAPADDPASNFILVHEFIHALQDREVDLQSWETEHSVDSDSGLAADSVVEGEARLHESRYRASLYGLDPGTLDWHSYFDSVIAQSDQWILEQPSRYLYSGFAFPYDYGSRFVNFAWEANAHEGVLGLFDSPPASTQLLMASVDGVAAAPPVAQVPAPISPSEWTLIATNALGAWGTFLVLAPTTTPQVARDLALHWRGDELFIYTTADLFAVPLQDAAAEPAVTTTAVVWKLELADESSASAVALDLQKLSGTVRSQGTSVTFAASDPIAPLDWTFTP